jgi:type IV pilus assembly protein PilC
MKYSYKALKNGKTVKASIEADDKQNVIDFLKANDFIIIEVKEGSGSLLSTSFFNKVKFSHVVDFTRQLSIMLTSGLSLSDSLEILKKQAPTKELIKMISQIEEDIRAGSSLSSSLKKHPEVFNKLYISLIKAGEASGKLDEIMKRLAENMEKQREFQSKTRSALIYPALVITVMLVVIFIMITFVVPQLLSLYKGFDIKLPLPTRILITISDFMQKFWIFIVAGVVATAIFLKRYLGTKNGKRQFDTFLLKLPLINKVIQVAALVTSTRTLSILIQAGVPILQALEIIVETTSNVMYQDSFANVQKKVEKGETIGRALDEEQIFPPIFVQMTSVGEKTGHLDETLEHLAHYFESEAELAVKAVTVLIEPIVLVILGVGVGFVVISIITPIFSLTQAF